MRYYAKDLSLDEKIKLLTGENNWKTCDFNGKLPFIQMNDGPSGLRKEEGDKTLISPAMPTLSNVSNTWNKELAYLDGRAIANECIKNNTDVILAPGVNIKRTPLCGRNFEYFSEDPVLAGNMAKAFIEGVENKNIGACLKHFALNNRELERFFISSNADLRTIREIYTKQFEIALKANPTMVMCSYNPINGIYASENRFMLKDLLRDTFGFKGIIVSDWTAVHDSAKAIKATLDLRMPFEKDAYSEIERGLKEGYITEAEIDERVNNLLDYIYKNEERKKNRFIDDDYNGHEMGKIINREAMILLKNEDNILPIKNKDKKVFLCGRQAFSPVIGGCGSAFVHTDYKMTSLGDNLRKELNDVKDMDGYTDLSEYGSKRLFMNAYNSDLVIMCVGDYQRTEGEAYDRQSIRLYPQEEKLILDMSKYNKNIVVVVYAGSSIDMSPWINNVKGVVFAGFAGESVNEVVAEILTGKVNPSGKTSETFPLSLVDNRNELNFTNGFYEDYIDNVFVGYRYYDKLGVEVLFPFGYGLSYSNFEYSNLRIENIGDKYIVKYDIENTSDVDGKETSEVYINDVFSMVNRPSNELKGFSKDFIKAHTKKEIIVELSKDDFKYFSMPLNDYYLESGDFFIRVGSSSRDIKLEKKINVIEDYKKSYSQFN